MAAATDDTQYDVIVAGAGAGGMLAALRAHDLGLSALVIEKTDKYGGTAATSGGVIWVPVNGMIDDDDARAYSYLEASSEGLSTPAKLRAYLAAARRLVDYLHAHTRIRYRPCTEYPDYYQHLPGAAPGGRSLDNEPFDARLLGEEFAHLREPTPGTTLMGRSMTTREAAQLATKSPGWIGLFVRTMLRYAFDYPWRLKHKRDRRLALGNALCAGLRHAMLERGIPLWRNTSLQSLVYREGRVGGVVVQRDGKNVELTARRGVVLATGGFERNQAMREKYLSRPTRSEWVGSPKDCNTGDGIRAGEQIGARLALMERAWGVPTVHAAHLPAGCQAVFIERAQAGLIVVNRHGRRFVNEALSYQEFVQAMYADEAAGGGGVPAFAVFDANFRKNCPFGPFLPGMMLPDKKLPADWLGSVYWKADSLDALAQQAGIDAAGLAATVNRFNVFARDGKDEDFGKGDSLFDRYFTLRKSPWPNPCLAPLVQAPFYAVRLDAGDTGTKGGLETDEHARVLGADGTPIAGLYGIGNCAAAVLGAGYPGAGGTIGPAMTFGLIAADHLARP